MEEPEKDPPKSNKDIEYFYDDNHQLRYRYASKWPIKSYSRSMFEKCEKLGEDEVRERICHWSERRRKVSEEWLSLQDFKRETERIERSDNREEESLLISRKALVISERATASSERATRIAISAIILSISMAIYEVMKHYSLI